MSDAAAWLDGYDRVVAAAAQHLPPDVLATVAEIGRDQRERRAYAGTVLLVGLAGGTGSGKSSLLNALANEEVSPSGAFRPTTSRPLAWIPADLSSRLEGLFDRFGIIDKVVHSFDPPIAIIDLPDLDSIDLGHRKAVAGALPIIDLVVWVLDPEKYRDRVLHTEHVAPLAIHHRRFRFVLNQIDRVDEHDIPALVDDLAGALVADGVEDPIIWLAAADPPSGPPIGVDAIWESLVDELELKAENNASLASELRRGLDLLAPYLRAIDFGQRWDQVRHRAAGLWALGKKSESMRELRMFLVELSAEVPNIHSNLVDQSLVDPSLDLDRLVGSPIGDETEVSRHLDATLGRYLRDRLRPRATARALADDLVLSLPPSD